MSKPDPPRIAVLGAGPIGLEAALYARTLHYPVIVYERGRVGEYVQRWGHVRLFTPDWWRGYAPKDARALAETLNAARVNMLPEDADYRTPWEREAPGEELIAYERDMMLRSAANLRALGLME